MSAVEVTGLAPGGAGSVTCAVDGCDRPAKAKALCEMHYRRQRRTGSPTGKRRPGPKPDPFRVFMRQTFGEYSDRTFDRLWFGWRMLRDLRGPDDLEQALAATTRPNGSINVNWLERVGMGALVQYLIEHEDDEVAS